MHLIIGPNDVQHISHSAIQCEDGLTGFLNFATTDYKLTIGMQLKAAQLPLLDEIIAAAVALKAELTGTVDLDHPDTCMCVDCIPAPRAPDNLDDVPDLAAETWDAAERAKRATLMTDGLSEF